MHRNVQECAVSNKEQYKKKFPGGGQGEVSPLSRPHSFCPFTRCVWVVS